MSDEITTIDGILWRNGKAISLPEADLVAREHYVYAEDMVKALEKLSAIAPEPKKADKDRFLLKEYTKSEFNGSYTEWLEQTVIGLRMQLRK